MKRIRTVAIILTLAAMLSGISVLSSCDKNSTDGAEYKLVAPDGAPALAIANLPSDIRVGDTSFTVTRSVVASSQISVEAVKSDVDLAIVPANLSAKIYNTSGGYRILAVVTNGNLYMTSSIASQVGSLQDLKGNIVYSIGQSGVPDMIFKTLLEAEGIEYALGETPAEGKVTIKYCLDGADVISQLALAKSKNKLAFGIYGEPAVTNSKAKGFEEVFDLQRLWSGDSEQKGYAQAVLIARDRVCQNAEFVARLLQSFKENCDSILLEPVNAVESIKAIYPSSSLQSNMTSQVIERCNIDTVVMDSRGREYLERTLNAVMSIDANLVGGKLPDDGFYFSN